MCERVQFEIDAYAWVLWAVFEWVNKVFSLNEELFNSMAFGFGTAQVLVDYTGTLAAVGAGSDLCVADR